MGAILGRVALDGQPVNEAGFAHALSMLRPGRCLRSDMLVIGAAGYGHHETGLTGSEAQPLQDGPLTLVADARIYNRVDLAQALDVRAQDHSDAALILLAYRRWGAECLAHMNGDFAFAVHDRDAEQVFLARDHIGARPLYWARRGNTVMFATLVHGLTGFEDHDWPLNEARIARYVCNPHEIRPESFVAGVEVVAPAHFVTIRAGQITRQRWWDPGSVPERAGITLKAAQDEMRALTEQAIQARLPGSAPVGAHFSGGIDSTLVTILAAKALQARGSNLAGAYAWCPPVTEHYPDMGAGDERRVIAAQCAALGVPAFYGAATGATFDALAAQPMELQGTADLMDELPIIAQAQDADLGVMLSGWGGDEVFSSHGNGHIAWMLRKGRFRAVFRLARRYGGGLRRPHGMARFLWREGIVPMLPHPMYRRFSPYADLYGEGAFPSAALRGLDKMDAPQDRLRLLPDANSYMKTLLRNGHIAERMATWAAWAAPAGFEYRYPLTDRHLLEFMFSLPPDIRFGDGTGRFLVRRAFAPLLPKGVKKNDLANEKLRLDNRLEWWRMLADQARQGNFDAECPWLDMDALKAALLQEPPQDSTQQIMTFARFFVAVRVYKIHARRLQARTPPRASA